MHDTTCVKVPRAGKLRQKLEWRQLEAWRRTYGESLFSGYAVFIGDDKKVLVMDRGDSYTTLCMYLIPLNCTLTHGLTS